MAIGCTRILCSFKSDTLSEVLSVRNKEHFYFLKLYIGEFGQAELLGGTIGLSLKICSKFRVQVFDKILDLYFLLD